MKVIVAFLLLASATAEIHNWVGLPEARFERLNQLLEDEPFSAKRIGVIPDLSSLRDSNEVNDDSEEENEEGSGINPGPDPTKDAVKDIVESLHVIIPAIAVLKRARDRQNHEYAMRFVDTLRESNYEDDTKKVFGAHIMALHNSCVNIKLEFARQAHVTGLFELMKTDDLDLTQLMGHLIAAADKDTFDIFAVFAYIVHKKELHNHPGVKTVLTIGEMLAEAACDVKLDGLVGKIEQIIENEDKEGDSDFKDKIIPYHYERNSKKCPGDLMQYLKPQQSISLKARILSIIFGKCKEVRYIRFTVSTWLDAIKLGKKMEIINKVEKKRLQEMIKDVTSFMESNMKSEAYATLGDYVLTNLRRAMIVGLAVHKQLESSGSSGPEPSGSPKPSERPEPSGSPKPSELPEPSATSKPSERPQPSGTPKPSEHPQPSASSKPSERPEPSSSPNTSPRPQPSGTPKPSEPPKPSGTPATHEDSGIPIPSERPDLLASLEDLIQLEQENSWE